MDAIATLIGDTYSVYEFLGNYYVVERVDMGFGESGKKVVAMCTMKEYAHRIAIALSCETTKKRGVK